MLPILGWLETHWDKCFVRWNRAFLTIRQNRRHLILLTFWDEQEIIDALPFIFCQFWPNGQLLKKFHTPALVKNQICPKSLIFNYVCKKLRFGSGIIGWVFVCVFCKQNAKMTKFVRKIVIFEFCKQNTLTVTLCMMPEPYLSFLQTEFKNVILAIIFINILLGAPELWCPGTRSLVPFQAD